MKGIHDRFSRLGVIAKMLRDAEGRERYDFFYKNGVPKWRGTGYYYSRYRPGLISVSVFLVLLTSGVQYLVQSMTYRSEVAHVRVLIDRARSIAWGPKQTPLEGPRKVKVPVGDGDGGRMVDILVHGNDVFLVGMGDNETVPLDESVPVKPSVSRTWPVMLANIAIAPVAARLTSVSNVKVAIVEDDAEESDASTVKSNGNSTRKVPTAAASLAGGRRRKAVKPVKRKPKEEKAQATEE